MGFKLKSGNSPKFKMVGSSPLHQETTTDIGSDVDEKRKNEEINEELKKTENKVEANPRKYQKIKRNWWETEDNSGDNTETKYDTEGNIIGEETKGTDRWVDKPILEVLGLSKKQREARKAKKAQKIEEAKKAEGEGTETYKQAKLVKRAKKKEDRQARRDIKKAERDRKKLAKFREKNPVTGKEAINLVTGGGNKSLEPDA